MFLSWILQTKKEKIYASEWNTNSRNFMINKGYCDY